MKTLYSTEQLQEYGIKPLTGEACGYGMRVLCDVSEYGKELLCQYFGLCGVELFDNWNTYVGDTYAIGSVMLTREALSGLLRFVLFRVDECDVIVVSHGTLTGLKETDLQYSVYMDLAEENKYEVLRRSISSQGGRNQHQFSGRTV